MTKTKQDDGVAADTKPASTHVGDEVWYVPHYEAHHLDLASVPGVGFAPLFHFKHSEDATVRGQYHRKGDRITNLRRVWRHKDGRLMMEDPGAPIEHDGPRYYWKATVTKVHDDGTIDIDLRHPQGTHNLQYYKLKVDLECGSHTWHPIDHSPCGTPGIPSQK